jgi:hypothetical protein
MKKSILVLTAMSLVLLIFSCTGTTIEIDPPLQTTDKTYVKFVNNSSLKVDVFSETGQQNKLATIPAKGSSLNIEIEPNALGTPFYLTYYVNIGVDIPFSPNDAIVSRIDKNIINNVTINEPISISSSFAYLILENSSNVDISLIISNNELMPINSNSTVLKPGEVGTFEMNSGTTQMIKIMRNTITPIDLPLALSNLSVGNVYTIIYTDAAVDLLGVTPFDINTRKKIWTIPTYIEPAPQGNLLTIGILSSRADAKTDGYILAGRVNYNHATIDNPHVGAVPYLGMISPTGEITRERKINLRANPAGLSLRSFIEDSNELAYIGQVYYVDIAGRPCILSTDTDGRENYFYDGFINDISNNQELHGQKMVKWDTNSYAVACQLREGNINGQVQVYIAKVTKITWDSVTHQEFWKSPEGDNAVFLDFLFDQTYNMLVVLADIGTGSVVYFVDATNGSLKYPAVYLNNYWMNGFFVVGQDYYVAGRYEGVSSTRGFIARIDVLNGKVNTQNPWLVDPTKYEQGSGNIWYILPENDGTLILAGWCVEDNRDVYLERKYQPWLLKYDLNTRKKIWEQIYNNNEGYVIHSVHHNAIGSYLLEIYNSVSYHSYLISTDILGKMSGNILPPLPRNSSMFTATAPGNPGISVEIIPLTDVEFSNLPTLILTKGQSGTITVQGTWASCQWYVDGVFATGSGSGFAFTTSGRNAGIYTVTVLVTNSTGEKRSASCRVTLKN